MLYFFKKLLKMEPLNYLVALCLLTLFSCNSAKQQPQQNRFFEGTIIYSIEYLPYSPRFKADDLKEDLGSQIITTLKEGNYKKQYVSPSGKIISERYLDLNSKKSYLKEMDNDTIYWFDITKSDSRTTFKPLNDTIISKYHLKGVETESTIKIQSLGIDTLQLKRTFYYSKKYKVNPNWYKDYNEDNLNNIIKYGKGILLFELHKGLFWEQKISVETITPKKVDDLEFLPINENTPLREL